MTRFRHDLSTEDAKIWRYVTRNVSPLSDVASRHPTIDQASTDPPSRPRKSISHRADLQPRPALRELPPPLLNLGSTADIDRRTARRFSRGEMAIDGRIDLHGLTLSQAHDTLTAFVRSAHARGARCIVVVTGKGKGQTIGKIRFETPHWLNHPHLRPLVLGVGPAHAQDGGEGALYVMLKRKR